jgi:peptidoglycan hydrolase-like protein with peptidoglycan-binding domain
MNPLFLLILGGGALYAAYKLGNKPGSSKASLPPYQTPTSNPNTSVSYPSNNGGDALSAPMSVLDVQKSLNALGVNPPLTEDGIKGPKTTDAIKSFQKASGLDVDGIPGPYTWKAIRIAVLAVRGSGANMA